MQALMLETPLNSGKVVLAQRLNAQDMKLKVLIACKLRGGSWATLIPLANSGSTASRKNLSAGRMSDKSSLLKMPNSQDLHSHNDAYRRI
jgi:hypothetical protein